MEQARIARDTKGRLVKGSAALPGAGRPKGSRALLSEEFMTDLRTTWEAYGIQALESVAQDDPAAFLRVVASVMPKDYQVTTDSLPLVEISLIGCDPEGDDLVELPNSAEPLDDEIWGNYP